MDGNESSPVNALVADAGRCVKCALCLPHCPTYALKGEEGDSPRGRIALVQALAEGELEPTPKTLEHLDGCLTCRACETVCPAGVPYGRLIDGARSTLRARGRKPLVERLALRAAERPRLFARLAPLARPVPPVFAPSRLRRYLRAMRRLPPLAAGPADGPPVALFLGCVARALDTEALASSASLLAAAGYRVNVPAGQTCCGALALHAGERVRARRLALRNVEAFRGDLPIIACATGCTAQLVEYGDLADGGADLALRVRDVSGFLAEALAGGRLRSRAPGPVRVALHTPCTQRNVLRSDGPRRVLSALPGVEVRELAPGCCGAAGSYFLGRAGDADALRRPLLREIRGVSPDCVVTSNFGCRLHLSAGLGGDGPRVMHLSTFALDRTATLPDH